MVPQGAGAISGAWPVCCMPSPSPAHHELVEGCEPRRPPSSFDKLRTSGGSGKLRRAPASVHVHRVTGGAHGTDWVGVAIAVDRLAQAADVHVHGALVDEIGRAHV